MPNEKIATRTATIDFNPASRCSNSQRWILDLKEQLAFSVAGDRQNVLRLALRDAEQALAHCELTGEDTEPHDR
jgi:hypothetical protein